MELDVLPRPVLHVEWLLLLICPCPSLFSLFLLLVLHFCICKSTNKSPLCILVRGFLSCHFSCSPLSRFALSELGLISLLFLPSLGDRLSYTILLFHTS